MKNKIFIIIIAVCLLVLCVIPPTIRLLTGFKLLSEPDNRNMQVVTKKYDEKLPLAKALNSFEWFTVEVDNTYVNYFPFYSDIIGLMKNGNIAMQNIVFKALSGATDEEKPVENVGIRTINKSANQPTNSGTNTETPTPETIPTPYVPKNLSDYKVQFLGDGEKKGVRTMFSVEPLYIVDKAVITPRDTLQEIADRQVAHINRLNRANKDVNLYVYGATRLQDTTFFNDIVETPKGTNDMYMDFFAHLDKDIPYDYFRIDTPQDRLNKLYKTDHHWTTQGAYEGYTQIINMMQKDTPDLKPLECKEFIKIEGLQWLGSAASMLGFNQKPYYDSLYVMDIDLPEYVNGEYEFIKRKELLLKGVFERDIFKDQYSYAYPIQKEFHQTEQNKGRNLLVIGDSFSWCIAPLLSAHFDNAYFFNTPWETKDQKIDYNQYIEEKGITDVLIMQLSCRLMFAYDDNDVDNFVTEVE